MSLDQNLSGKIEAIVNLAGYWGELMPKKPGKRLKNGKQREWDGLVTLLKDFSTFATDYGFILSKAPIANQRLILNEGIERLLKNFDVLSRASEQRRGTINIHSPGYHLAQAEDKLSEYCSHWLPNSKFHSSYVTLKTPVAYFEKIYGISRALYTPEIPIISIPLTDYNDPDRWLALAHEMGHHIYWNSLSNLDEVEKLHLDLYDSLVRKWKLPSDEVLEPWGLWLEEIFADVCGVLLAGPHYVISAQNVAAEKVRRLEDFAKNDYDHPSLYLRPWIAYLALYSIQSRDTANQQLLEKLKYRWSTFCEDASQLECNCGKKRKAFLGTLQAEVETVVSTLLNEPLWPYNQRLVDLIEPAPWDINTDEIAPLPSFSEPGPDSIPEIDEANLPKAITEVWSFIKERFPEKKEATNKEKLKKQWEALVSLSLEDEHGHWPLSANHGPQVHWWAPWAGRHTHDTVTGAVKFW